MDQNKEKSGGLSQKPESSLHFRIWVLQGFGFSCILPPRYVQILLYTTHVVFEKESQWLIQVILINVSFKQLSILPISMRAALQRLRKSLFPSATTVALAPISSGSFPSSVLSLSIGPQAHALCMSPRLVTPCSGWNLRKAMSIFLFLT